MREMDKKVAIIVLNWNGGKDTLECLESLKKLDYPDYEIVVVDNGSTDGSPQLIKKRFPEIILIENEKNLGFAEGNNVGIRFALEKGAKYIFLLNNDTIVDEDILGHLIRVAESDSAIGILGPKIYYHSEPNKIWFVGGVINWRTGRAAHFGMNEVDKGQFDELKEVDYVTGCALMVRREVIEDIGLMDSRFFLYYEETDWCTRAKKVGYKIMFEPQAKVWHKISISTGGVESAVGYYYYARNKLLLARKNLSLVNWLKFLFFYSYDFLGKESLYLLRYSGGDKWKKLKALWTGFYHYLRGRVGEGPKWLSEKVSKSA